MALLTMGLATRPAMAQEQVEQPVAVNQNGPMMLTLDEALHIA